GLERPLLVPDRDCIRIVLVLGLAQQPKPAAGIERGVVDVTGPEGHAGDRDDPQAGVLPANRLARRRVAQVVAGAAALEPKSQPLVDQNSRDRKSTRLNSSHVAISYA